MNVVPASLSREYGSRTPLGLMVFPRLRPFRSKAGVMDMPGMPGMKM